MAKEFPRPIRICLFMLKNETATSNNILFLFSSHRLPAAENSLSEGAEVDGTHKNLLARTAKLGNSVLC